MAAKVDAELRAAVESVRASDDERLARLAAVDEELKQIELVTAHASRARRMIELQGTAA